MRKHIVAMLFCALAVAGCQRNELMPNSPPDVIYKKAVERMEDKDWEYAKKYIETLREDHPFSPFAVEGELLEADVLYREELFKAAIESYTSFEELHPFHEKAPYALYMRGVSNFMLIDSEDRDITYAREAKRVLDLFVRQNPRSPNLADAKEKLQKATDILAEHELYVGVYYANKGKTDAAINRLKGLVRNYPESSYRDEAVERIQKLEATKAAKKD